MVSESYVERFWRKERERRNRRGGAWAKSEHGWEHARAKERAGREARAEAAFEPGAWFELREVGGAKPRYAGKRVAGNRVVEVLRRGPTCDTVRTVGGALRLINREREAESEGEEASA